jgi:hypothetical protein
MKKTESPDSFFGPDKYFDSDHMPPKMDAQAYIKMFTFILMSGLVYIAIHIVGLIISYILPFIY